MLVVHTTDAAQVVYGGLVVQVADQGIAGVGGYGQNTAFFQQGNGLFEQAWLRVLGVDFEILCHLVIVLLGVIESGCSAVPTPV